MKPVLPIREAVALYAGEKRAVTILQSRIAELRASAAKADGEAAALREGMLERQADALLKGEDFDPAADEAAIRAAERASAPADRAAEKIEAELEGAVARRDEAHAELVHGALVHFPGKQADAVARFKQEVLKLHEHAARMLAAEFVRDHFAGSRPVFDADKVDTDKLWNPSFVLPRFIGALPARLVPEGFTMDSITAEARRLAAAAIAELKEAEHG